MARYECPICKAHNGEHQKYCVDCGTWLLSDAFPAKKVIPVSIKKGGSIGFLVALIVIGALGYAYWTSNKVEVAFGDIQIGDTYLISQLMVSDDLRSGPSVVADLSAAVDTNDPLEIRAVFYDAADKRLMVSEAIVSKPLRAKQTTTVTFDIQRPAITKGIANVRIEVTPMSPFMLLERMDKMGDMLPE